MYGRIPLQVSVNARRKGQMATLVVDQESIPAVTADDVTNSDLDLNESLLYFAGIPLTSQRFAET